MIVTEEDRIDVARALSAWMKSQGIDALTGAFTGVILAGSVAGVAAQDADQLEQLLDALHKELDQAAHEAYARE